MRLGVLDVGSNTVHLVVVDSLRGTRPDPRSAFKESLRLAELVESDGRLSDEAAARLVASLTRATEKARSEGVEELLAFATSAVRDATNSDALLARVHEETGIDLRILSGEDEARVTFLAVRRWVGWSAGELVVADIGGGSLELARGAGELPDLAISLPLGSGRVHADWLAGTDPPSPRRVEQLRDHLTACFGDVASDNRWVAPDASVYATSKTFRTLASLAARTEGSGSANTLKRPALAALSGRLLEMTIAERGELPGVSANRAEPLAAGSLIALQAMETMGWQSVKVCPWALREGLTLRWLDTHSPIAG